MGELRVRGMVDEKRMSDDEQTCYSAIIVPYGNSVADRLPRQLALGVPVIMMRDRTDVDEFWYEEVQNGTQWIEATPETLEVILEQLMSDQERQARIGDEARRFVEERFSERRLKCYVYRLLSRYAKEYSKHKLDSR